MYRSKDGYIDRHTSTILLDLSCFLQAAKLTHLRFFSAIGITYMFQLIDGWMDGWIVIQIDRRIYRSAYTSG